MQTIDCRRPGFRLVTGGCDGWARARGGKHRGCGDSSGWRDLSGTGPRSSTRAPVKDGKTRPPGSGARAELVAGRAETGTCGLAGRRSLGAAGAVAQPLVHAVIDEFLRPPPPPLGRDDAE